VGGERFISARRVRGLLALFNEAAEIRGDLPARRAHLVRGIARLLGVAFTGTVVDEDFRPGGRGRLSALAAHGLDGSSTDVLSVLVEEGTARHPALRRAMLVDDYSEPLVWRRRERLGDREWFRDSYVVDYVMRRHLGEGIFGAARIDARSVLGVGAMREARDPAFTDEDLALFEAYADGARPMWCEPDPAERLGRKLPPRLRALLTQMLSGLSEKEIAAKLGLTWSTVHTYTRQLYRALGVSSRAQLLMRLR
jgi:Bacterial regulatory proteins, luxR family